MKKLMVILAALTLVFSLVAAPAYAQGKAKKEKAAKPAAAKTVKAQKASGTISSVSDTSLTVKTATGDSTFVINPQTKKEGTLQSGAKAKVSYKTEGNDKVATEVKAKAVKVAKAAAPKAKSGKKKG
jgi:hypothetical protein